MPLINRCRCLQQSGSFRQMSSQMKGVRSSLEEQMGENEQLRVFMSSLRGSNLSDADFADSNVQVGCRPAAARPLGILYLPI